LRRDPCINILRAKNEAPLHWTPKRSALIVVDMQRYFTQPGFPFSDVFEKLAAGALHEYLERVRTTVIPNLQRMFQAFRSAGSPVIFTALGSVPGDGGDLPTWLRSFDCLGLETLGRRVIPAVGDASWEIDAALRPESGERVVNKLSAGTFATTALEDWLREASVDTTVVTGVTTDVCVTTTAREAADRDFQSVVVSDACAAPSSALHTANLETLQIFGWVREAEDILRAFRSGSP